MRTSRSFPTLLAVAILLGAVVWFAARDSFSPVQQAEFAPPSSADSGRGPPESAQSSRSEELATSKDASARAEQADSSSGEADLEEFAAPELLTRGTPNSVHASARGVIVDPQGKPIAKARVLASLAKSCGGALLDAAANLGKIREVETDGAGKFNLVGLDLGPLRIAVRAAGFAPLDTKPMSLVAGGPLELGELQLQLGLVLSGTVVDPKGAPVPSAQIFLVSAPLIGPVRALGAFAASPLGASDESGHFELAAIADQAWTLLVRHPDFPDGLFLRDKMPDPAANDGLKLELAPAATIGGHLAKFELKTLPLIVVATPIEGLALFDQTRPPGASDFWLAGVRSAEVNERGEFEVHGLVPTGNYALRATPPDARMDEVIRLSSPFEPAVVIEQSVRVEDDWAPTLVVPAGESNCELSYLPGCSIDFEVVDGLSGAPIEHMLIDVWGSSLGTPEPGMARTRYPDGRVLLAGLRPRNLNAKTTGFAGSPVATPEFGTAGPWTIDAPGHEVGQVGLSKIWPGRHLNLGKIQLLPLPPYEVKVEDAENHQPLIGARVELNADEMQPLPSRTQSRGITRRDGIARLTSLTREKARLEVSCAGYVPDSVPAPGFLPPGSLPIVVSLTRGARIVASVRTDAGEIVSSATVTLQKGQSGSPDYYYKTLEADSSGRVSFVELAGGSYLLGASRFDDFGSLQSSFPMSFPMGEPTESVIVPEGGDVLAEIRLKPLSKFSGTLMMGREPLVGALISFAPGNQAFEDFGADAARFQSVPRLHTDSNGEFHNLAVEPGEYTLLIDHELRGVLTRRLVRVAEGKTELVIDVDDTRILGRVLDKNGAAVGGARVRLFPEAPKAARGRRLTELRFPIPSWSTPRRALAESVSDSDGSFRLGAVPPNTKLQVFVREGNRRGLVSGLVVDELDAHKQVDVRLVETGALEIVLHAPDQSMADYNAAWIYAPDHPDEQGPWMLTFDENHRARFDHLLPGHWIVVVDRLGAVDPFAQTSWQRNSVSVREGEVTELKLTR